MVANRFCFYPCPLQFPENSYPRDLDAWDELLIDELLRQAETRPRDLPDDQEPYAAPTAGLLRFRTPVRFDFELEAGDISEPSSHVHINSSDARIPVHAALSLSQFVSFVIEHYFPSHSMVLAQFPPDFCDRSITRGDEERLHVDCRQTL
jgi:hypothetical protein